MATRNAVSQQSNTATWIAAIDTSSDRAGVALFDGTHISVIGWNAARNHTVTTLGQLDHLLGLANIEIGDLRAVAVAIGPGSFSALRVGLSIAKGLAFALDIPVLGVPTTEAIATQFEWTGRPVVAVMPAGRERVVWCRYQNSIRMGDHRNTTVTELKNKAADGLIVGEYISSTDLDIVEIPAAARVESIARIGWRRFVAGERDDAALLEPLYVHGRRDAVPV